MSSANLPSEVQRVFDAAKAGRPLWGCAGCGWNSFDLPENAASEGCPECGCAIGERLPRNTPGKWKPYPGND
jgi:predicted  nucleic acid-binding Zn-ribbon protein